MRMRLWGWLLAAVLVLLQPRLTASICAAGKYDDSGETTTLGGSGATGNADGIGTAAQFKYPNAIAMASDDSFVLICDYSNHNIRKVVVGSSTVSTLAGEMRAALICLRENELGHTRGVFALELAMYPGGYNLPFRQEMWL